MPLDATQRICDDIETLLNPKHCTICEFQALPRPVQISLHPRLGRIILMENQCPDFNALPDWHVLPISVRVHKRSVWNPPRPPIRLGIKALDQQHLFRSQAALVIPAVGIVVPDLQRLPLPWLRLGVYQTRGDEVGLGDRVRVRDGQGVAEHSRDGPPDVDNLHPPLEQLIRLVREVVRNPRERRRVGLIYVHALDWAPAGGLDAAVGGQLAADGVVEYKDSRCASTGVEGLVSQGARDVQVNVYGSEYLHVFEQLLRLLVVSLLDLLVI